MFYYFKSYTMSIDNAHKFIDRFSMNEDNEIKLKVIENDIRTEYNNMTLPYRNLLLKIGNLKQEIHQNKINNCDHDFERICEYHNERYYICKKCNYEKE